MPPSAVIRLMTDNSHPACSRVAPRLSRIDGRAGGALPTWKAATMPAATSRPISGHGVRAGVILHPRGNGAVYHHVDAGDERGGRARQEHDGAGHLLRRAHATGRIARQRALVAFGAGIALAAQCCCRLDIVPGETMLARTPLGASSIAIDLIMGTRAAFTER